MKKKYIIKKNHEFQSIIKKRDQIISKELVIYRSSNKLGFLRMGISVSKKFANAVWRNYYRRQTRHAIDVINMIGPSYDIVIILRKPFLKLEFKEKVAKLEQQLRKV